MKFAAFMATLALAAATALPARASIFTFSSQAGDPIGQGQSRGVQTPDYTFTPVADAYAPGRAANILVTNGSDRWQLLLWAPAGSALAVGAYDSGAHPDTNSAGVTFVGPGGNCSSVGRFSVLEITRAVDGTVTNLAVDFEHRCEASNAGAVGMLRFNSALGYTPPGPLPPYATRLTPVNIASSYDVAPMGRVSGLAIATENDAGLRMASQALVASAGCGTFDNGSASTVIVSDSSGIAQVPAWNAPSSGPQLCSLTFSLFLYPNNFSWSAALRVGGPLGVASALQFVDSQREFQVTFNRILTGVRIRTVDSSGAPVANAPVQFLAMCGRFNGEATVNVLSDASGIASMPPMTAWPAPIDCDLQASLMQSPYPYVTFRIHVVDTAPAGTATRLMIYGDNGAPGIPAGYSIDNMAVFTTGDDNAPLRDQAVTVTTEGCGMFPSGATTVKLQSNAYGIATLPRWTGITPGTCRITVSLDRSPSVTVTFTPRVDPPPTPVGFATVDNMYGWTVAAGGTLSNIRMYVIGPGNVAHLPGVSVTVSFLPTNCGSFAGASQALAVSDANGIVTLPTWTAGNVAGVCTLSVIVTGHPEVNHFSSVVVTGGVPLPPAPPPPNNYTPANIYLSSDRDDPLLSGGSGTLTNDFGFLKATVGVDGAIYVSYWNQAITAVDEWIVAVMPASGSALAPGSYESVQRVGTATTPGAYAFRPVLGPAGGCTNVTGRLVIHEIQVTGGAVTKFAADLQQHCDGHAGALYVGVRYNSSVGYTPLVGSGTPTPPPSPQVVTIANGTAPGGGTITLTVAATNATCTLARASFIDPALISPPVAPLPNVANLSMPSGYLDFRTDNCGSGQLVTFNVDFPQELPPTAQWWKYGPTPDNHTSHWYAIPSTVSGRRISFTITDGGLGDDDLTANGSITDLGALAIPGGTMQDLWWSGISENGWGMTIVQHRDVLFGNFFVYDANGVATWYVLPSGSWDTAHKVYTGDVFLPKSSPYFAYDVSKFDIGASLGTARITFNGVNDATLDYTINGITGHKNISRIPFGPVAPPTEKPLGDLWWAGLAQNGWGLVLSQQYATLFGLWFTYDANGKATWFVMPNVEFVSKDVYRGNIYRPEGSAWLGATYDASRHRTVQVGTFVLRFSGDGATLEYTIDGNSGSIPISRIPF